MTVPKKASNLSTPKKLADITMRERKRQPTHPGGILKRHYLDALNLSVADVARALRVSRKTLSKLVNERGAVTPDMALRLSKAFNTTPELWLNLQQTYDLWHTAHSTKGWMTVHAFAA